MSESEGSARGPATLAVVIPTLNEADVLPQLLKRLFADGADLVVVADGGSDDRSIELAKAAGALTVVSARGRGQQLRAGALAALQEGAELLWFVHADNLPLEGALHALRSAAHSSAGTMQAWACRQRVDASGRFYRLVERKADRRVAAGLVYGDSGLFVTASAYEKAGGFRGIPLFEDLDLSRRLAALGPVSIVDKAQILVNARRWQVEGALRTTIRNWILTRAWNLGVAPERLVRFYPVHSRRSVKS